VATVAAWVGVSEREVQRWANGSRVPSPRLVKRLKELQRECGATLQCAFDDRWIAQANEEQERRWAQREAVLAAARKRQVRQPGAEVEKQGSLF